MEAQEAEPGMTIDRNEYGLHQMEFSVLSDLPEAIPQVARWYFDEWGYLLEDDTYERSIERLGAYVEDDQMPVMVLAIEHGEVLGVAQLKLHELEDAYPELENWLGGVYVAEEHRGKGVGARLVERVLEIAPRFGVKKLYLQTEVLDGGLYARLGWKPMEQYQRERLLVLIMERSVGSGHVDGSGT